MLSATSLLQVALDKVVVLDDLTQLRDVVLGQILDADVGVDAGFLENLVQERALPIP